MPQAIHLHTERYTGKILTFLWLPWAPGQPEWNDQAERNVDEFALLTYLAQAWGILRTVQKLYMFYMKVVHHKHIRMMVKPLMRFQLLTWHMIKRDSHLGAAVLSSLNGEVSVKTHFSCSIISSGIIDAGLTDCRVLYPLRVTSSVQLHHWWQPLCQPERKCKLEKEFESGGLSM